jgi:hypothetical protein
MIQNGRGVWARQPLALLFHSEQEPLFHQLHQRFFRKARLPRDSIPQIAPSNPRNPEIEAAYAVLDAREESNDRVNVGCSGRLPCACQFFRFC